MADKEKEAGYIEQLRLQWPAFPGGKLSWSERPDFVVQTEGHAVGIEVTEFFLPPEPGETRYQEAESIREQIMSRARAYHTAQGGPPLLIDVEFDDRVRLTKRDIESTARALAACILQHQFVDEERPGWYQGVGGDMPRGVTSVSGGKYQAVENWDFGGGGWVRPCTHEHIQAGISRKVPKYAAYRENCNDVFLVVVSSVFAGAPTEIPFAVLEEPYDTPFEKTIAFLIDASSVFELRRADLTV